MAINPEELQLKHTLIFKSNLENLRKNLRDRTKGLLSQMHDGEVKRLYYKRILLIDYDQIYQQLEVIK